MKFFSKTPNFPFVPYRKIWLGIATTFILASSLLLAQRGLNFGTDFAGGIRLQYQLPATVTEAKIRETLQELPLGEISVVRFGKAEENRWMIKVAKTEEIAASAAALVTPRLISEVGEAGVILESEQIVGPKVGKELQRKGILAVLFTLFCILIYTGFRLDFYFAPAAILALFHDVIVTLGAFALLQWEFDLTVLAACLTIVGYSINDSIVVFDRIREHARLITPATFDEVVNTSLNETLSRTIITSLTVFFVVLVLYFFGGATIKGFAFAMTIGTVMGSFSTFSVVAPCYVLFYRLTTKRG